MFSIQLYDYAKYMRKYVRSSSMIKNIGVMARNNCTNPQKITIVKQNKCTKSIRNEKSITGFGIQLKEK